MARISIFTPVRNGVRFVDDACQSDASQSCTDWQHVILDAVSDDGTSDALARHAAADERIKHFRREDEGQYDALMRAMLSCDTDFVGWLNIDDLYPPWALATVIETFDANPTWDWLVGMPSLWTPSGHLKTVFPRTDYRRSWIAAGYYHDRFLGCLQQESIFFRRKVIERLTRNDIELIRTQKLAGDFALWRALSRDHKLHSIPTVLGGFRLHGKNRSTLEQAQYENELNQMGAPFPPRFLANPIRRVHDATNAYLCLRRSRAAAFELHQHTNNQK